MGEEPGGAGEEEDLRARQGERGHLGDVGDRAARIERLVVLGRRLLEAPEPEAFLARSLLHLGQQVVDRLVAGRGHPDTAAAAHELSDQPGARPRLARARGALDEEVPRVQVSHQPAPLDQIERLDHRPRRAALETRGLPLVDVAQLSAPVVNVRKGRKTEVPQSPAMMSLDRFPDRRRGTACWDRRTSG